jgi:hypothetical protein
MSNTPGFVWGFSDLYDGAPWAEEDERDLKDAVDGGDTLEEAATLLCRSGTLDDVAKKAQELGLRWRKSTA